MKWKSNRQHFYLWVPVLVACALSFFDPVTEGVSKAFERTLGIRVVQHDLLDPLNLPTMEGLESDWEKRPPLQAHPLFEFTAPTPKPLAPPRTEIDGEFTIVVRGALDDDSHLFFSVPDCSPNGPTAWTEGRRVSVKWFGNDESSRIDWYASDDHNEFLLLVTGELGKRSTIFLNNYIKHIENKPNAIAESTHLKFGWGGSLCGKSTDWTKVARQILVLPKKLSFEQLRFWQTRLHWRNAKCPRESALSKCLGLI